ncbi:MAG: hypothetical protein EOM54_11290 [Clostridia bacterium]|nr:hypothetical protein [Clostridia bacterium]
MSIVRKRGMCIPTCDICGEMLQPEDSFPAAVQARREAGWKSSKNDDGDWEDACAVCRNGGAEKSGDNGK